MPTNKDIRFFDAEQSPEPPHKYTFANKQNSMLDKKLSGEIEHLHKLLHIERDDDRKQYLQKIADTSYSARRKEGICWYPIVLTDTSYDGGERLRVSIERHREHELPHAFQSGKPVQFFANGDDNATAMGVINYVKGNEMAISLTIDEEPDWFRSSKLGVQLLFDENSYRQMDEAMKCIARPEHPRLQDLISVILGTKPARFAVPDTFCAPSLNQSQNEALQRVGSALDVAIIHGPPGTGKTTTMVQAILHALRDESQILVCAPSNTAVDLLVERLSAEGADVLRLGHASRLTEEILQHSFDVKSAQHIYSKQLREVRRQADEMRTLAGKYKRSFGHEERQQRRELYTEAKRLTYEAEQLAFYISSDIISKAQVIATTLVGAAHQLLKGRRFGTVFIDEAAQALEPACWIPIIKAERVIFAGDHLQLPPTVKSFRAAKEGLSTTLFEKALERNTVDSLLREQYRMHKDIMAFPNEQLYGRQLIAHESVREWLIFPDDLAVEFIDTAGCGFADEQDPETKSYRNRDEGQIVFEHLLEYCLKTEAAGCTEDFGTVGIIAPYKAQVNMLKELFADTSIAGRGNIAVNTIDSFQGQECDIIYISLTRSNDRGEIGFLQDIRRMNVAITRAKKKLVVIGDSATVSSHNFYDRFIAHASEVGGYRSAYEFMWKG